jgi:XTP/dITP diphosphohydrolase
MPSLTHSMSDAAGRDGIHGLVNIVERLGIECPWTRKQNCDDMIYYARKEILEVEDVFRDARKRGENVDAKELTKELGDVLFDALMMIEVTRRSHPEVNVDACAASALEKLRRRAPYMFNGKGTSSIEEAEAGWQAAKQAERAAEMAAAPAAATPPAQSSTHAREAAANDAASELALQNSLPPLPRPAPTDLSQPALLAGKDSEAEDDGGLGEWERDFKSAAGPPSEDDDSEEEW